MYAYAYALDEDTRKIRAHRTHGLCVLCARASASVPVPAAAVPAACTTLYNAARKSMRAVPAKISKMTFTRNEFCQSAHQKEEASLNPRAQKEGRCVTACCRSTEKKKEKEICNRREHHGGGNLRRPFGFLGKQCPSVTVRQHGGIWWRGSFSCGWHLLLRGDKGGRGSRTARGCSAVATAD